jgi:hypothetical protein
MLTPKPKLPPPVPASRKPPANAPVVPGTAAGKLPGKPSGKAPPSVGVAAPSKAPANVAGLRLRPMVRVQRVALFEREVRERLSRAALELLFRRAEVMSEGQLANRDGRPAYFGSTMLTMDLEALAPSLRESCDAGTARRLTALLGGDPSVATRIKGIATREAVRLAGGRLRTIATEMKISARGARIFIDVDVEGTP